MKILSLLFILSITACSTPAPEPFPEQNARPFQTAGHEQFFLPELPHWANGSIQGRCARNFSVRYLDFTALEKIHGLTYKQSVELQAQFNLRWHQRFADKKILQLTPQEEATLFLETLAQVKAGLQELRFPAAPKTTLVWWDSLTAGPKLRGQLLNLANAGQPVVLVSVCQDQDSLEQILTAEKLDNAGFFVLGSETLTSFRPDKSSVTGVMLPLDEYFQQQSTTLWSASTVYPVEFPQGFTVKQLEE